MQIGTMRHRVEIFRYIEKQSESGAASKVRTKIAILRCALLREYGSFVQTQYEENDKHYLVFQTWLNRDIKDSDTLCWSGQDFKITLIEQDELKRLMKIHACKIND